MFISWRRIRQLEWIRQLGVNPSRMVPRLGKTVMCDAMDISETSLKCQLRCLLGGGNNELINTSDYDKIKLVPQAIWADVVPIHLGWRGTNPFWANVAPSHLGWRGTKPFGLTWHQSISKPKEVRSSQAKQTQILFMHLETQTVFCLASSFCEN